LVSLKAGGLVTGVQNEKLMKVLAAPFVYFKKQLKRERQFKG